MDDYILVIEDDRMVRDSIVHVLRDEGYNVVSAANGKQGLDYLSQHPAPCLILLDLMMPVMGGDEFRTRQLQDAAWSTIPTVLITAAREGKDQAKQLGVDFLCKPIELERLLSCVERAFASGRRTSDRGAPPEAEPEARDRNGLHVRSGSATIAR